MKVGIIGTETLTDDDLIKVRSILEKDIDKIIKSYKNVILISRVSKNLGKLTENIANKFGLQSIIFYPDFNRYERMAILKRDEVITKESDILIVIYKSKLDDQLQYIIKQFKNKNDKILIIHDIS